MSFGLKSDHLIIFLLIFLLIFFEKVANTEKSKLRRYINQDLKVHTHTHTLSLSLSLPFFHLIHFAIYIFDTNALV